MPMSDLLNYAGGSPTISFYSTPSGNLADAQARSATAQVGLTNAQTGLVNQQASQRKKILDLLLGRMNPTMGNAPGVGQYVGGADVGNLLGQIQNAGAGQTAVINQGFDTQRNSAMANLAARNIAGSNLVGSYLGGIERQRHMALGSLQDQLLSQRLGVQERGLDRQAGLQSLLANLLS